MVDKTQEALKMAIEALEKAKDGYWSNDADMTVIVCKEALAELQAHDDEVIEKCAKVVDNSYAFDSDGFAKAIRALKHTS